MRHSITHITEILLGAVLTGLGLIYLISQYKALSDLADMLTEKITENSRIIPQYSNSNPDLVTEAELYSAIMGYRDYPVMIDGNLIPAEGQDYELYFSYIREGLYKKEYRFDEDRNIIMIKYSHTET